MMKRCLASFESVVIQILALFCNCAQNVGKSIKLMISNMKILDPSLDRNITCLTLQKLIQLHRYAICRWCCFPLWASFKLQQPDRTGHSQPSRHPMVSGNNCQVGIHDGCHIFCSSNLALPRSRLGPL